VVIAKSGNKVTIGNRWGISELPELTIKDRDLAFLAGITKRLGFLTGMGGAIEGSAIPPTG
jgi:hypothetical protein